jgi:hypothetical protein
VVAEAIAGQVLEDVAQGLLADLADGAGRELELIAVTLDEPGFFEQLGDLLERGEPLMLRVGGRAQVLQPWEPWTSCWEETCS